MYEARQALLNPLFQHESDLLEEKIDLKLHLLSKKVLLVGPLISIWTGDDRETIL